MKYGNNLRLIRQIKNISIKEMASTLNMSTTNYNKVEHNKINLSDEKLTMAANALGTTSDFIKNLPDDLLHGVSNHQAENANFQVHIPQESLINMLQAALAALQEDNAHLRKTNEMLLQKLVGSTLPT